MSHQGGGRVGGRRADVHDVVVVLLEVGHVVEGGAGAVINLDLEGPGLGDARRWGYHVEGGVLASRQYGILDRRSGAISKYVLM